MSPRFLPTLMASTGQDFRQSPQFVQFTSSGRLSSLRLLLAGYLAALALAIPLALVIGWRKRPLPQIPLTSDPPTVFMETPLVPSILNCSTAPELALMPKVIFMPSNAGPAAVDEAISLPTVPKTISRWCRCR